MPATQNFCQLLSFRYEFLKFDSISCFVFLWDVNRVSPGITGYHRVSPGITGYHRVSPGITGYHRVSPGITGYHSTRFFSQGLRRSEMARPGGGAKLSCSPGPRSAITKFWHCIHCLQLSIVSYKVLHCYPRLALAIRL